MWQRITALLLLLFVPFLLLAQQSQLQSAIERLTQLQGTLSNLKLQLKDYELQIKNSLQQISDLQKQLEDSKNKSLQTISELRSDLEKSKQDLLQQQQDLEKLETLYRELSKEYGRLQRSLKLYKTSTFVLGVTTAGLGLAVAINAITN